MASHNESIIREPLITGNNITYAKITNDVLKPVENMPTKAWWIGFTIASMAAGLWVFAVSWTFWYGVGEWGLNKTVGWAWDITGFSVVGRYRSRRNPDLGNPFIVPSKLA